MLLASIEQSPFTVDSLEEINSQNLNDPDEARCVLFGIYKIVLLS
jgi:hypothetical protein